MPVQNLPVRWPLAVRWNSFDDSWPLFFLAFCFLANRLAPAGEAQGIILLRRRRDRSVAGRLPDPLGVSVFFVHDAEKFAELPSGLEFVNSRSADPRLRIRLRIIHDDLYLQIVLIHSA